MPGWRKLRPGSSRCGSWPAAIVRTARARPSGLPASPTSMTCSRNPSPPARSPQYSRASPCTKTTLTGAGPFWGASLRAASSASPRICSTPRRHRQQPSDWVPSAPRSGQHQRRKPAPHAMERAPKAGRQRRDIAPPHCRTDAGADGMPSARRGVACGYRPPPGSSLRSDPGQLSHWTGIRKVTAIEVLEALDGGGTVGTRRREDSLQQRAELRG